MQDTLPRTVLRRPVGLGRTNDRDDIRTLKTMMARLGRLPEPEDGFTGDFDTGLEKAVIGFQKESGLTVDGRLMPGGETERALRDGVRNSSAAFALRPDDLTLLSRVGAGGGHKGRDAGTVAKTLANLGFLLPRRAIDIEHGDDDARFVLENAVRSFQMSEALDPDGRIEPDGPTVTALMRAAGNRTIAGGEGHEDLKGGQGGDDVVEMAAADLPAGVKKPGTAPQRKIEWKQVIPIQVDGHRDFKVKGPIRVDMDSPIFGDGLRYQLPWQPLYPGGRVMQEVHNPGTKLKEEFKSHVTRRPQIHKPPYDHPHGFRVEITIPPQQRANGIGPGPSLRIFAPRGGVLK